MLGVISIRTFINEIGNNRLSEKTKLYLVYLLSALFIVVNSYLIYKEIYWGVFIPLFIVVAFFFLFAYDKVVLLIIILTPLSVYFLDRELNVGISLPVEPLMIGVLFLFFLKILFDYKYDRKVLRHPVSVFIIIYLAWMLVTTITSQIPLVSIKFFLSRLWFVIPIFFVGIMLFKDYRNIKKLFWYYAIPLMLVIAYTTVRHYFTGFDEKTNTWVMKPFYNDHTAYGAVLSMFIPVFIGFALIRDSKPWNRRAALIVTAVMLMALMLSFSRAAWLSVALGFGVFIIIIMRIKFRWLLLVFIVFVSMFYTFRAEIVDYLAQNKQDSSANFVDHVQSIVNISTDASNLERINRWQAAFRMFNEKPVLGFGPGTYQFLYAPFQRSKEKTIISTNFGDVGNAHSEYIGPLAESGFLGMLTFILVCIAVIYTGLRVYRRSKAREVRIIGLSVTIGLITYMMHGFLNNFLDTEKLSIPFWGFAAVLVALNLYHMKKADKSEDTSSLKSEDQKLIT